ncbi:MAG TPA: ATP-binding protein [Nitrospirales bacterium]|nr:ATP-binding protein [Nitrospirales bacterium]
MNDWHWQIRARFLMVIGLALLAVLAREFVPSEWPLLAVCACMALYNYLLLRSGWLESSQNRVTFSFFALDLLSFTAYLHYSGDVENPLRFAYAFIIVAGSSLLSTRSGFVLAALATVLFVVLGAATWTDALPIRLPHHHLAIFDPELHGTIDPAQSTHGWSYLVSQDFRLSAVLFGFALAVGMLTGRVHAKEGELKVQHDRMESLLNTLSEGVVLLSRDGAVMLVNRAARMILPIYADQRLEDLAPELGIKEQFARFEGTYSEFESNSGGRILNHVLARESPGEPVAWVFRNTTEQRRMMAELMHKSKMADMGLLAAGIAHEVGNPLSTMSATLEMVEMKNAPRELLDRLRPLEVQIQRIGRIVQDIRVFTRPSSGRRQSVGVEEILKDTLGLFRLHEKSARVDVDAASLGRPAKVAVVPDQIVQVILNLLLNAADACGRDGKISVQVEQVQDEVRVSVIDNGKGMGEETRRHLFSPFFTTKEPGKGTGLGLFVSESIVRAHGGRIDVRSSPGKGSTFTVCLPPAREA